MSATANKSLKMPVAISHALLCLSFVANVSAAADPQYPSRPIRMIVPFPPAGSVDIVGRVLGKKLGERFGVQIVIDNRPGANTIIGTDIAAKATADGHTLLLPSSGHATNPSIYKKLPFDSLKDFTPILLLTTSANVLVVNAGLPLHNLPELIAQAKAKPGQLTFASGGYGGVQHLAMEMLKLRAGIDLVHVPYKGAVPALVDTMAGQMSMVVTGIPPAVPYIKSGKLRAILVTSSKRAKSMPDVATVAEQGFPGFDVIYWIGVMGPAGLPVPIVNKLNTEFNSILQIPDVQQQLELQGADPVGGTPAEFLAFLKNEIRMWAELVKTIGLKPE